MTENIFDAGEIIEALNKRLRSELSDFICHGDCHEFIGPSADNKIREHAKAIIEITQYESKTVEHGKHCKTCGSGTCHRPFREHKPWMDCNAWVPEITKATFGLEQESVMTNRVSEKLGDYYPSAEPIYGCISCKNYNKVASFNPESLKGWMGAYLDYRCCANYSKSKEPFSCASFKSNVK